MRFPTVSRCRQALFLSVLPAISLAQGLSFDPREATIASTHHASYTGSTTCREIVSSFLSRIEALNNHTNAIITLNPDALSTASHFDTLLASHNASTGRLFCIPVLLKDNYDTANMPTTGGNSDSADSRPSVDAPAVTALKDAGAIVLGKANSHELALEGLSVSSLGGQTINPYDSTRTPGGSSGGSGAAVAASFSVFSTGSDTVNSLRSPASANSSFSCRPTRGLISRAGIIPISYTQDVIGPIGRCVEDVATASTVMSSVGFDADDNATALAPAGIRGTDYYADLTGGSLQGMRFGLPGGFFNRTATNETTPVNSAMAAMVAKSRSAGATIVPINDTVYNATAISALYDTQRYEYRQEMDVYLQRPSLKGTHPTTSNQLYNSSKFSVIPSQYEYVTTSSISSTDNVTVGSHESYDAVQRGIANSTLASRETFVSKTLDALIYPEQKNLVVKIGSASQSGRNGILAAVTGSPVITVPAGFSPATDEAPIGVPIGMEILGSPYTEQKLSQTAWQIQESTKVRRTPVWARQVVPVKPYANGTVPVIRPDRGNISPNYPLGTL